MGINSLTSRASPTCGGDTPSERVSTCVCFSTPPRSPTEIWPVISSISLLRSTGQLGPGYSYAPGLTAGNPIASLLLGDPSTGTTGVNIAPFYSQHYVAFWGQDDWKITSKLTLNLGIRYDLLGARTERHNQLNGYFDTTAANPYGGLGGLTLRGSTVCREGHNRRT